MGKDLYKALTEFQTEYQHMDIYSSSRVVRLFKVDKMFQQDQKRVSMYIFGPIGKDLVEATTKAGATLKVGRAPASYMERELKEFLEAMEL